MGQSVAEQHRWISAQDALRRVMADGTSESDAKRAIMRSASGGLIDAKCVRAQSYDADILGHPIAGTDGSPYDNWQMAPAFWMGVKDKGIYPGGDWVQGDFDAVLGPMGKQTVTRALRVQFREDHVLAMPAVAEHAARVARRASEAVAFDEEQKRVRDSHGRGAVGTISAEDAAAATVAWAAHEAARRAREIAVSSATSNAAPAPPRPRKPRQKRRIEPVTHLEFMAWYDALPAADRERGYRLLSAAANKHFHPRRVPRKWSEEQSKDRKPGPKPKA